MAEPRGIIKYTLSQIQELIDTEKDARIGLCLCAIYQVALRKSPDTVAAIFHVSRRQLYNRVEQFEKEGRTGLERKPGQV